MFLFLEDYVDDGAPIPKSLKQHHLSSPPTASCGTCFMGRKFTCSASIELKTGSSKSLQLSTEAKRIFPDVIFLLSLSDLTLDSLLDVYPRSTVVSRNMELFYIISIAEG